MTDKYDVLLFDADDTLFDFKRSSRLAFERCMMHLNIIDHDIDQLFQYYEKINFNLWKKLELKEIDGEFLRDNRFKLFLEEMGYDHFDGRKVNDLFLSELIFVSKLFPGVPQLLKTMAHKKKLIVTNGLKEVQRARITAASIEGYFEHIVVSDEIGFSKPSVEFFEHVFELLDHPPKHKVLMIGDSLQSDIQGGINYGLDTCWINWSKKINSEQIKPTYEVQDVLELMNKLN